MIILNNQITLLVKDDNSKENWEPIDSFAAVVIFTLGKSFWSVKTDQCILIYGISY